MKSYPSIDYWNRGIFGENIYAFDKLDGSNIRVEWSRKRYKKCKTESAFYKFGTRNNMINRDNFYGDAIDIFFEKYADDIQKVFLENKKYRHADKVTFFLEYFGQSSFAGWHDNNEEKDLLLFDIFISRRDFVAPKDFVKDFGHLHIPQVVYQGTYNKEFVEDVKNGVYDVDEGVVVKGCQIVKSKPKVWMVKVKTNQWLDRVKNKKGEIALIKELNNDQELITEIIGGE